MKRYRNNGAIGALLDEYEKAIYELLEVIHTISIDELQSIVDTKTDDPDCVSIQSILNHVIRAGYTYVREIRNFLGENIQLKYNVNCDSIEEYRKEMIKMFEYNEQLFNDYPNIDIEETDVSKKIRVPWNQDYDIEQLLEHAIVHILRHRRQIEKFILELRK